MRNNVKKLLKRRLIAVLAVTLALQGVVFVAPTATSAAAAADTYRWRNDDGSEVTATYSAPEGTSLAGIAEGETHRLRIGAVGSTSDQELIRRAATALDMNESYIHTAVIDTVNGYIYFGTDTAPGIVIKVALGSGSNPPTRIGQLTLQNGENYLYGAVIDVANGFAYFSTGTSPGRVVKIALGAGNALPTRVSAIILETGENSPYSASIDTEEGFAYFGTGTSPGRVVKIDINPGNTFARVGAITLSTGENSLYSSVIDTTNNFIYFGTNTSPGRVVKVNLATFARVTAITLSTGENVLETGIIDVTNGFAYFGTDTNPGRVVKVNLSTFTRVTAITLSTGEDGLKASGIDLVNQYAYFGTYTYPARLVKVNLGTFTRTNAVTLSASVDAVWDGGAIDATNGYFYLGPWDNTLSVVAKIALGAGATAPSETALLTLSVGESAPNVILADTDNGFLYVASPDFPSVIIKMSPGADGSAPIIVDRLVLNTGDNSVRSGVIDIANGFAYFGTQTTPGRVIKVDINPANAFARIGHITLSAGENSPNTATIDTVNDFAYFGTGTTAGRVVKVDINPSNFVRIGAITLDTGENLLLSAVIDTTNNFAYFGTDTSPARIVKVNTDPSGFARAGAITLPTNDNRTQDAVVDVDAGFAYFGLLTAPAKVVKVDINPGNTFAAVSTLTLDTGENSIRSAGIHIAGGYAYFGTNTNPGKVVRVALGSFTRVDALTLSTGENSLESNIAGPLRGHMYVGTSSTPDFVVKFSVTPTATYRLEYGEKSTTCGAIATWTEVAETPTTEDFAMSASANITDGSATTDIAGLANGESVFIPGSIHDVSSETGVLRIDAGAFTELEFSVEATASATPDGDYCFRLTDAGSVIAGLPIYAEGSLSSGGGSTNDPTLNNSITASRLKAGASSTYDFGFTLQNAITGTLTITFPAGFTVTAAATSGACTGGTVGTFGFTAQTLTAVKTGCTAGALTLSGATVTNHSTPGAYTISWVNDDPGEGVIYIIDDDQVTVTGNVDPTLTFNAGMQDDATACDGTFSGNGGILALGVLTTGAVTSSDASSIDHICTRLSTNASGGASVTVRSANGTSGLVSTSVPVDTIPSATATLVAGTAGYGLCTGSAGGDSGNDVISGSASPTRSAPFNTTCTNAAHDVGGLTTSAQNLWTLSGPSQNAFVRTYVKAAISGTTAAHADYADTLTFVGTGTF